MERGSDKHNSRLDESLKHDSRSIVQGAGGESRAQEAREQEGPGDDDPTPDARLAGGRLPDGAATLTDEEIESRADLARHLEPSVFPARPGALRESAERQHAPGWILEALDSLPDDTYATTEEVWVALGGAREQRGLA